MSTVQSFPCVCGIRREADYTELWLVSPKTGKRISIRDGWWHQIPRRLIGRIAKAASEGKRIASFTTDELRSLLSSHLNMECCLKAKPAVIRGLPLNDYRWAKARSYR